MTGTEFHNGVTQLERFYQKELEQFEKDIWYRELCKMNVKRFNQIIQKVYTECKFMPKLADILAINQTMSRIDNIKGESDKRIDCEKCKGIGVILYTKLIERHEYTYVARCTCENGNKYTYRGNKYYIPSITELRFID